MNTLETVAILAQDQPNSCKFLSYRMGPAPSDLSKTSVRFSHNIAQTRAIWTVLKHYGVASVHEGKKGHDWSLWEYTSYYIKDYTGDVHCEITVGKPPKWTMYDTVTEPTRVKNKHINGLLPIVDRLHKMWCERADIEWSSASHRDSWTKEVWMDYIRARYKARRTYGHTKMFDDPRKFNQNDFNKLQRMTKEFLSHIEGKTLMAGEFVCYEEAYPSVGDVV